MTKTRGNFPDRLRKLLPPRFPEDHHLVDRHQSVWQLASVQLGGGTFNTLAILLGTQLQMLYGVKSAVVAIVVGNIALFCLGVVIVLGTAQKRQNTYEMSLRHLGKWGGRIVAITLLVSTFGWFSRLIAENTATLLWNLGYDNGSARLVQQWGTLISFLCILLSMYGIKGIRKFTAGSTIVVFFCFLVAALLLADGCSPNIGRSLSFAGIPIVIVSFLPGTADFPTFFRHAQSTTHSLIAIAVIFFFTSAMELLGIFVCWKIEGSYGAIALGGGAQLWLAFPFLATAAILSVVGVNAANIYSASVGYEAIVTESLVGRKEYFLIGIFPTFLFLLFAPARYFQPLYEIGDLVLGVTGVVVFCSILYSYLTGRRAVSQEIGANVVVWLFGLLCGFLGQFGILPVHSVVSGAVGGFLGFMLIVGARETIRLLSLGKEL